jgi:hypothetical protein
MAIYNLEIYDEGQPLGFWKTIGLNRPSNPADRLVRVKSVADMVTKVLAATEGQREKVNIFLKGEGKANYQSVGAGATQDPFGDKSLQTDGDGELNQIGKIWLPRLIGRVGRIYLLGIEDGGWNANNKGSFPLLNAIAALLTGVHIHGQFGEGSGIVYFPNRPARLPLVPRTTAERQKLRETLKRLDRY